MNFSAFKEALPFPPEEIVFVGLGNMARGDDAAGLLFLRELRKRLEFLAAHFINAGTNPENHLQQILDFSPSLVVFIDAARCDRPAGEMFWIETADLDTAAISTHAFSIRMIEEYLKANSALEVKYFGIQPETTTPGSSVSDCAKQRLADFFSVV
jgi:hydrogenase maturation protease